MPSALPFDILSSLYGQCRPEFRSTRGGLCNLRSGRDACLSHRGPSQLPITATPSRSLGPGNDVQFRCAGLWGSRPRAKCQEIRGRFTCPISFFWEQEVARSNGVDPTRSKQVPEPIGKQKGLG
jgi:hypothetical protein